MYPNKEEVEKADRVQICRWYRFLQSPTNQAEISIMNRIVERFWMLGGFTPKISKLIGWEK